MTRTEERLTDALTATADAVDEDTLRPLVAPARRHRRHVTWMAPIAAAASVLLVVGLVVGLVGAGHMPGTGPGPRTAVSPVPRYYVTSIVGGKALGIRSVATQKTVATVTIPGIGPRRPAIPVVAAARNGMFFAALNAGTSTAEQVYRFQVTAAGKGKGFAKVPGARLPRGRNIDAMAASPDGSRLAVGVTNATSDSGNDQVTVINTRSGAQTVWRGVTVHRGQFSVSSLSWTAGHQELAVLGQWCQPSVSSNESCHTTHGPVRRTAEVWALDPASGGGLLSSGHLLLRQSASNPNISQAVISPDGSVITAVVLTGQRAGTGGTKTIVPGSMQVRQISVATGQQVGLLYRTKLPIGDIPGAQTNNISLSSDSSGQHWLLSALFDDSATAGGGPISGWIRDHKLVFLGGMFGSVNIEAW